VFSRTELQPVVVALQVALGMGPDPLDTPCRLEDALAALIDDLGGTGTVVVRRSPAALMTPEYWSVVIAGMDPATHTALLDVFRAGRP